MRFDDVYCTLVCGPTRAQSMTGQYPFRNDAIDIDRTMRADTPDNPWVCELGHSGRWPSFDAFCRAVLAARCDYSDSVTTYASPSLGTMKMGWEGPLTLRRAPGRHALQAPLPGPLPRV